MIVVKIELWPFGNRNQARELGRMYITNDGTGDQTTGNYDVAVARKGTKTTPQPIVPSGPKPTRSCKVLGHKRLTYPIWHLILKALRGCFPEVK